MTDANTAAQAQTIDPVAAARAKLAGEESSSDAVQGLKRQVRALWVVSVLTLVLVIALAAFSFLPRVFGFGGMRGAPPDGFQPGMRGGAGFQGPTDGQQSTTDQ